MPRGAGPARRPALRGAAPADPGRRRAAPGSACGSTCAASFGRGPVRDLARSAGCWTGAAAGGWFRLSGAARARLARGGQELVLTLSLTPGEQHDLVLEISDRKLAGSPPDPGLAWAATQAAWASAVPDCADLIAVSDARHAYAVLTGLTASSGAMVAAATTSLPERLESVRNYDYRYAWIRDQCYTGLAVAAHGPHPLLDRGRPVHHRAGAGRRPGPDARLHRGRGAAARRAHDARSAATPAVRRPGPATASPGSSSSTRFGEVLQLLAAAARLGRGRAGHLAGRSGRRGRHREALVRAGRRGVGARRRGTGPIPGWPAWPGCARSPRRPARQGRPGPGGRNGAGQDAGRWSSLADQILASLRDSVHPSGRWQRAPGDPRVDASLLLPVIRGAVPPDDPRARATVQAVTAELADDGFVYRFRHDDRPLHEAEGAFLLCGFWMALAAQAAGDEVAAVRWFERDRAACGPAGIYTEEYDVHQHQLRGNLPQAFVHAALLESAVRLSPGGKRR